jgi:hypothetical protein
VYQATGSTFNFAAMDKDNFFSIPLNLSCPPIATPELAGNQMVQILKKGSDAYFEVIGMYQMCSKRSRNNFFCAHATSRDALTFLLIIPYRYVSMKGCVIYN